MKDDVFDRSDDWLDGYDAGRRTEKANFIGFMIAEGIVTPDKISSAIYDSGNSELVRLTLLDYINSISERRKI